MADRVERIVVSAVSSWGELIQLKIKNPILSYLLVSGESQTIWWSEGPTGIGLRFQY
jgi:hypothetical protein